MSTGSCMVSREKHRPPRSSFRGRIQLTFAATTENRILPKSIYEIVSIRTSGERMP